MSERVLELLLDMQGDDEFCIHCGYDPRTCECADLLCDVAERLIELGYRKPPIVTTAEELDALPVGSVVLVGLDAWQKSDHYLDEEDALWWSLDESKYGATLARHAELLHLTITVLHIGGAQ